MSFHKQHSMKTFGTIPCLIESNTRLAEEEFYVVDTTSNNGQSDNIFHHKYMYLHPYQCSNYDTAGADPEGGFGDLSLLNFLEEKIIKNV